jgi:transposase
LPLAAGPPALGGRPRIPDRAALTGILFVFKTGIHWEDLPPEMGCGCGMSCWRRLRDLLRQRGITPRIARRGQESRESLGRWRWVVERTSAWLHRYRRLRIRYERRAELH